MRSDIPGYALFIFNAHIPYIKKNRKKSAGDERWLFKAIGESYLPLLDVFLRLKNEGTPFKAAFSLSPTLITMLADPDIQERCREYLIQRADFYAREAGRESEFKLTASMHATRSAYFLKLFTEKLGCRLLDAFKSLSDSGHLELMTTAATHAFLPLLEPNAIMSRAQIKQGLDTFAEHFGFIPNGFWLPECGCRLGFDKLILEQGPRFTVIDTLAMLGSSPKAKYASFRPFSSPSGLALFANDISASLDIWSAKTGYYTAPEYLWQPDTCIEEDPGNSGEFPAEELACKKNTGPTDRKGAYNQADANKTAWRHASAFLEGLAERSKWARKIIGVPPVITISVNAEFFGSQWFEGPLWLEYVLRASASEDRPQTILPSAYLEECDNLQISMPTGSSWGDGSFGARWLNSANDWAYKQVTLACRRYLKMVRLGDMGDPLKERLINQAGRELMLAQASDWPLLLSAGRLTRMAQRRLRDHLVAFWTLFDYYREGRVDEESLRRIEGRSEIFRNLDYKKLFRERQMAVNMTDANLKDKHSAVSQLAKLREATRELAELCRQALQDGKPDALLAGKARESIAIVEEMASEVNDEALAKQYALCTHTLNLVISDIAAATTPQELEELQAKGLEAADEWTRTADMIMAKVIG